MLLLHVQYRDGEHHRRKVALHLGDVVHAQQVDVVEGRSPPEGERVAAQLLDALLIRLALLYGLHLEVFLVRNEVFVVEQEFGIVLTDDVVADEPFHRLLVHTRHGEDAEGTLSGFASLRHQADFVTLLGSGDEHRMARLFRPSAQLVVEDDPLGIARKLLLQLAAGASLVGAVLYHEIALLLLLLHPVLALTEGGIRGEERTFIIRVLFGETAVAQRMRDT